MVNSPRPIFLLVNTNYSPTEEVDDRDLFTAAQFVTDRVKNFILQMDLSYSYMCKNAKVINFSWKQKEEFLCAAK